MATYLSDPAFFENRRQPLHNWTPWIGGFSSAFVADCLNKFAIAPSGLILDPFCGVGTTNLTAAQNGISSIGFDINPYAVLASKVKLRAMNLDLEMIEGCLNRFLSRQTVGGYIVPAEFGTRIPFFSDLVLQEVCSVLSCINSIKDEDCRDLFRVAFGSVMVSFSNYSYEPSLSSRPAVGKSIVETADVFELVGRKVSEMLSEVRALRSGGSTICTEKHCIVQGSILTNFKPLTESSVDLVVTSPPYLNNYHYVRNSRPQLFWLGLVHSRRELRVLEQENFGKYWQTVRGQDAPKMIFSSAELIDDIRRLSIANPEKLEYSGKGWASYVTHYFNDTYRLLRNLHVVLRSGASAVIVVGNSVIQGQHFPVDTYMADLAEEAGLEVVEVERLRIRRHGNSLVNSSVRESPQEGVVLYESAVIVRKR